MRQTESVCERPSPRAQSDGRYVLGRSFVLRVTGFPVETIEAMASPELAAATDEACAFSGRSVNAGRELIASHPDLSRSLTRQLKRGRLPERASQELSAVQLEEYRLICNLETELQKKAETVYERELQRALGLLYRFVVREPFQQVLLLSSPELAQVTPPDAQPSATRNSHTRQREFTWISYLQRLATKNETISFFGPSAWGTVDEAQAAAAVVELGSRPVAERKVYVERWVCEALAALISTDPEARPFLPIRLADDVALRGHQGVFLSGGAAVSLVGEEHDLLLCCESPRRGMTGELVESLIDRKLLVRNLEIPSAPFPFEVLRQEIALWPDGPVKTRWSEQLESIDQGRAAMETAIDLPSRSAALESITQRIREAGLEDRQESQILYTSRLPINEDCRLDAGQLVLGRPFVEQVLSDLAPWYDLWRDMAGLYATRLHSVFEDIWRSLGSQPVPLPLFVRVCNERMQPLWATGGSSLGSTLEEEIQAAWREQIGERWNQPAVELTEQDTSFLRRRFRFRRMKAFDNMCPDLQIVAPNAEALSNGRWQLLVAEIHPDLTLWEHCFFMWCPDAKEFSRDYSPDGGGSRGLVIGRHHPHFVSAHTTLCVYPYAHDWTFVGVPAPPGAKSLRSAETLVQITSDDVLLLHTSGRVLGSLLHTWNTALNTHRLELNGGREHSPRLQVGRAIVQRESWTLQPDDLLQQAAKAGGYAAFAAFREWRRRCGLPENAFIRGCLPRLNFHKDAKPMFMNFRNPLLIEVLGKMVNRFRRIFVAEMLPGIEDCWLETPEGHYSCEFRTLVKAARESRDNTGD